MRLKMLLQTSFPTFSIAFGDMVVEIRVSFRTSVPAFTLVASESISLIGNGLEEEVANIWATAEFHGGSLLVFFLLTWKQITRKG